MCAMKAPNLVDNHLVSIVNNNPCTRHTSSIDAHASKVAGIHSNIDEKEAEQPKKPFSNTKHTIHKPLQGG